MRLAITVCRAGDKCIKDDTLCKTPKESDKKDKTTTTGVPVTTGKPVVSKTTLPTTTTPTDVVEPQVLPQHGKPYIKLLIVTLL